MSDQALKSLDPTTIQEALPTVMKATKDKEQEVTFDACLALIGIAQRPDAATLLRPWHSEILALLDRPDIRYTSVAVMILEAERPAPKDVVPRLHQLIMDDSKGDAAKSGILHALLRLDQNSPQTQAAMLYMMSKPLSRANRVNLLNVIGGSHSEDDKLIALIKKDLSDKEVSVRATAIQTLNRLGPDTVAKASAELGNIANDTTQPKELRDRAHAALTHTVYTPPRPDDSHRPPDSPKNPQDYPPKP
jgi:hypothetical protein